MGSNNSVSSFWLIWHDLYAAYEGYARKSGLTCVQIYVIEMLDRVPDCTQKTICECTALPKQNVNAMVKKFAADGLVELAQDAGDRRNKIIRLTEKGRQLHQSVIPRMREAEIAAMQKLSQEGQNEMIRMLEIYVSGLKNNL